MKTVIITALVAVSLAFTAYASLPPDSGSLDWEEIEMQVGPTLQRAETVCQSFIQSGDDRLLLQAQSPDFGFGHRL